MIEDGAQKALTFASKKEEGVRVFSSCLFSPKVCKKERFANYAFQKAGVFSTDGALGGRKKKEKTGRLFAFVLERRDEENYAPRGKEVSSVPHRSKKR